MRGISSSGVVRSRGLHPCLGLPCLGQEPPFECFAVTDLERVFEDGYQCPAAAEADRGLRHPQRGPFGPVRRESPTAAARSDRLRRSAETSRPAMPSCRQTVVTWNFVGSILIAENSPNHRKSGFIRPAPARFPDYLSDARQMAVEAGRCQAVYLTIRVPKDAQAGRVRGRRDLPCGQGRKDAAFGPHGFSPDAARTSGT